MYFAWLIGSLIGYYLFIKESNTVNAMKAKIHNKYVVSVIELMIIFLLFALTCLIAPHINSIFTERSHYIKPEGVQTMPYIERQIKSGDLLEVDRYFATRDGKRIPRGKNESETSQDQNNLNNKYAQDKLMRKINANFNGKRGDAFVTLTYREPPADEATAKRDYNKFSRKVRAYRKENGLTDYKYIVITEKQGQWHHHVIMNGLPLEVINELWGHGRVTMSILDNMYNFEDLAKYLIKPEKKSKKKPEDENAADDENGKEPRRKYTRRWSCSKNLKSPEVIKKPIKRVTKSEPKAPKGYRLLPDWHIGCDKFGNLYQHYKCVKLEELAVKPSRKPCTRGRK